MKLGIQKTQSAAVQKHPFESKAGLSNDRIFASQVHQIKLEGLNIEKAKEQNSPGMLLGSIHRSLTRGASDSRNNKSGSKESDILAQKVRDAIERKVDTHLNVKKKQVNLL